MAGYIGSKAVSVNTTSATISDDLTVGDDATIAGTLGVTGVLTATSLDISGAIDVDGTSNLDVIDVDGAANFAADVTFAAGADIITASAGTSNVRVGVNAGNSIVSGGTNNVVVGEDAGTAISTGDNNVAVGTDALQSATTPSGNVAIGSGAMKDNVLSESNVAIGMNALNAFTGTTGSSLVDSYNVAVGHYAGVAVTTGSQNTLLGAVCGNAFQTTIRNTSVGYGATRAAGLGKNNTCVGAAAGLVLTGESNTIVGPYLDSSGGPGEYITSGDKNTVIGNFGGNAANGHGATIDIRTQDNTASISDGSGNLAFIKWSDTFSYFFGGIRPWLDDSIDLGVASNRFDDIFATNSTINTSDRTLKQDEAVLSSAEMAVAARISGLFKNFRWKSAVATKGNDARTHSGVIAQDVVAAFEAESLDSRDYALFISSDWWTHPRVEPAAPEFLNEDGTVRHEATDEYTTDEQFATEAAAPDGATKHTRLGIRYTELLSFLAAYNEQRFAAIETRLTALEG